MQCLRAAVLLAAAQLGRCNTHAAVQHAAHVLHAHNTKLGMGQKYM
jgi:predicted small secreted protein